MADRIITAAAAQTLQDEAHEAREMLTWIVMEGDGDHPEGFLARPVTAGAGTLPCVLVADALAELRAKLPAGLVCSERQPADAPGVVEIWVLALPGGLGVAGTPVDPPCLGVQSDALLWASSASTESIANLSA
jgi:hypothetical protein